MAKLLFNTPVDMTADSDFTPDGEVVEATKSRIVVEISSLEVEGRLFGSFQYDADGFLRGGTFTGVDIYINGKLDQAISDLSLPVLKVADLIFDEDSDRLYRFALSKADLITASNGGDVLLGYGGNDTVTARGGNDKVSGGAGNDRLLGGDGNDQLLGQAGADTLLGDNGADTLTGGAGRDRIEGGKGRDIVIGGAGADWLSGGAHADTLRFLSAAESSEAASDTITDFIRGEDVLDLRRIDADRTTNGNQAFDFIGAAGFRDAGDLRYANGRLQGDFDGDGRADLEIVLDLNRLGAADILL